MAGAQRRGAGHLQLLSLSPSPPVLTQAALSRGEVPCHADTRPAPSLVTPCSLPSVASLSWSPAEFWEGWSSTLASLGLGFLPHKATV